MTDTRPDQRGTDTQITQHEVDRAWADSVGACDWYERCSTTRGVDKRTIAEAKRRMLETTEYAEKLQNLYNEQRDELEGKRVAMINVNGEAVIAYNEMIDARIERAQRTWGMK